MTVAEATILSAFVGAAVASAGWLLTWFSSRRQRIADFRMAALEKRLATHQEAYALWHEMLSALHDRTKGPETAARCQQWWISHCLYLDAKSREAFIRCAHEAYLYRDLADPNKPDDTEARFNRILKVFDLLAEGVQLPSIGAYEGRRNEIKKA